MYNPVGLALDAIVILFGDRLVIVVNGNPPYLGLT